MPLVRDPLLPLCQIIVEKLREHPQADPAALVVYLSEAIAATPDIAAALQTDARVQINHEHATGFQSWIAAGGIGNIGLHLHGLDKTNVTEVLERFLRAQPFSHIPPNLSQGKTAGPEVFVAGLPEVDPNLHGRERQFRQLDRAWSDLHTRVIAIIAAPGVGKTSLAINWWHDWWENRRDTSVEKVLVWPFQSQGNAEERQVTSEPFLIHALQKVFRDPAPIPEDLGEKGKRLAQLVRAHKSLLILDGLETLYHPPWAPQTGLKDEGIIVLLKELAADNSGLCICTSRRPLGVLKGFSGRGLLTIELRNLSETAGARYLRSLGVWGDRTKGEDEVRKCSKEFGNNALALTLVGTYLVKRRDGDARRRDTIPSLFKAPEEGGHARRIMRQYEDTFKGLPELTILRLMALFDRPVEPKAITALRRLPGFATRTGSSEKLSDDEWDKAIEQLMEARLVDKGIRTGELDCHPLVREHFAEEFRTNAPHMWRAAHVRLFNHYRAESPRRPRSPGAMEPALRAVRHGCLAQRHAQALQLHYKQILDGEKRFIWKKLGLFGSNLWALAYFFDFNSTSQWQQPSSALSAPEEVWVLAEAALSLFCLGRAEEAFNPSLLAAKKSSHTPYYTSVRTPKVVLPEVTDLCHYNAAVHWGTHSTICLALGQISKAICAAKIAVKSADGSGDTFRRIYNRCILANAYHQAADIKNALRHFRAAERLQTAKDPSHIYLDSIKGYTYCDLLLTLGKYDEVEVRAKKALLNKESSDSLVAEAFQHLALARCYAVDSEDAERFYSTAIQGLRDGGNRIYLCQGLLFKAAYHRQRDEYDKAQRCIDEVRERVTSSDAMLIMTDLQIEQGYMLIHKGKMKEAIRCFRDAEQKITRTGYRRREREVFECLATRQEEVVVLGHDIGSQKNRVIEPKDLQANCVRYRACAACA